jgi:hypothetical protein
MGTIPLLVNDASEVLLGALLQPAWGIYYSGTNQPVIQPASFAQSATISQVQPLLAVAGVLGLAGLVPVAASVLEFEYRQDFPISTYPQEEGAFQAYNKVTLPWDVRLRLTAGGSATNRKAFIEACIAISQSFQLFDVLTPERPYVSVNCNHIDFRRSAKQGNTLIAIDLGFINIPVVSATTGINTAIAGDSAQQSSGNVTPQTPNSSQAAALANGTAPL